jgi:lactate dehydrogenase-like 2-hydroxyacid dehydrogenase
MEHPNKPEVIVSFPVEAFALEALREHYSIHYVPRIADRQTLVAQVGGRIDAVITNGSLGWPGDLMRQMPKLKIIAAFGAGYENIDIASAKELGLAVVHGRGTNTICVADHALALLFAIVRDIVQSEQGLRQGDWKGIRSPRPDISGRRLGIFGMGAIGRAIAKRAEAFDMQIFYHNRNIDQASHYVYVDSLTDLARQVDFLICAAPGGAATHHLVNTPVLEALGKAGYLVNVGRGSVVDTEALAQSLNTRMIAGAALDVFEGEPKLPEILQKVPNLIVTPHIAGFSPDSFAAYLKSVIDNIDACLGGKALITPIP